ncbi:ABC transporter substrate-binding protein [Bradyrhizobium sp. JR3.5]
MLRQLALAVCLFLLASYPAVALDPVSLQLKWKHQFQFAGYYAAVEQGFYRNAGLDVTIREGGPDIDAAEAVAGGQADFGVCTSSVLREWVMGRPPGRAGRHLPAVPSDHSCAAPGRHQKRLGLAGPHADGHAGQR